MTTAPDGGGLTEAEREALGLAVEADLDAGWSDMDFDGHPLQIEAAVERILAARSTAPDTEAIAAALEEAADERGELWAGPHSVCFDCANQVGTWLHGRAAAVREGSDT